MNTTFSTKNDARTYINACLGGNDVSDATYERLVSIAWRAWNRGGFAAVQHEVTIALRGLGWVL